MAEMNQFQLSPDLRRRMAGILARPVHAVRPVQGGYTPALRLLVTYVDGSTAFAKIATNEMIAEWLRKEHSVYQQLSGEFMPRYLGWDDDGEQPILLLEDLSSGHWPPPWTLQQVGAVQEALAAVSRQRIPNLHPINGDGHITDGWQRVAADPEPLLSLGLVTADWLERALPVLLGVDGASAVAGDALLHADVRSDNICLLGDRAVLVDWNWVSLGRPEVDVAFWLPSLHAEGGPPPEAILAQAPTLAAVVSGFFAARAGGPPVGGAPQVRHIQQVQLKTALPWVTRALDLPPPDSLRP